MFNKNFADTQFEYFEKMSRLSIYTTGVIEAFPYDM